MNNLKLLLDKRKADGQTSWSSNRDTNKEAKLKSKDDKDRLEKERVYYYINIDFKGREAIKEAKVIRDLLLDEGGRYGSPSED
jgi:hypothetical protein